jgi:hypothetical protein
LKIQIPFFTDHNVPDSVGAVILAHGHQLTRLRDCMVKDTKDPVIAIACSQGGQVLVSHDNDFKEIAKRLQVSQRQYRGLHRIKLSCFEPESANRIADLMSLVEHEWSAAIATGGQLVMDIRSGTVFIVR